MATLTTVITSIRASVDRDGADVQVPDTVLTAWVNEAYLQLRRRLADLVPDLYTVVSADLTIASGNALSLSSLTTLGKILAVQRKESADYYSLPLAPATDPDASGTLSYRQRGTAAVDIFPATSAPGTYRVRYVSKPAALTGSDAVDLPEGGERILIEDVAARCRLRWEEAPDYHLRARDQAWEELRNALVVQYLATTVSVVDMTGEF